ncbi:hypothetical protein [Pseudonocardia dioxanivorans]|uniref:hypothetical protein n=1 Tax=Pseudonocardia dioxanivorans TaxID=240495 RepID=UPI001404D501|nr:hypothetical protein [Pseudonocardia dioxanivorans]
MRTTRETDGVVVVPLRNHNRPKAVGEPLDTFAASGNHHGLAMLMRNNTGGAEMCTPLDEPARTITTAGHQSLVSWNPEILYAYDSGTFRALNQPLPTQTTVEGDALLEHELAVEECRFRMLTVDEVKLGMAFAADFVLLARAKRDRVKMCGHAVTPARGARHHRGGRRSGHGRGPTTGPRDGHERSHRPTRQAKSSFSSGDSTAAARGASATSRWQTMSLYWNESPGSSR